MHMHHPINGPPGPASHDIWENWRNFGLKLSYSVRESCEYKKGRGAYGILIYGANRNALIYTVEIKRDSKF